MKSNRKTPLAGALCAVAVVAASLFATVAAPRGFAAQQSNGVVSQPKPTIIAPRPAAQEKGTWSASGALFESCTCMVPCTCNFGEAPSPHDYCHAVWAYRLDKAQWNGVELGGFTVAGADGPTGAMGFTDSRANATQRVLLEKIAREIFAQGGPSGGTRTFVPARITSSLSGNAVKLEVAPSSGSIKAGGFTGRLIIGRDGKNPVVVENNTTWPVERAAKGKASSLNFTSPATGKINETNNNINHGQFAMRGRTPADAAAAILKRSGKIVKVAAKKGCCAARGMSAGCACCAPKR